MNSKILLLLAIALGYLGINEACAHTAAPPTLATKSAYMPELYAGLSGGIGRMNGRRNDSVFNPNGPETIPFFDNAIFKDTNSQYSFFGGASWTIPGTSIFIGPEIYIGRAHSKATLEKSVHDALVGDNRSLVSTVNQSTFLGVVARIGASIETYSGYILLGGESSQFEKRSNYTTLPAPMILVSFNSRKWLRGFLWGVGCEKKIASIRLGAEVRFIRYGTFKSSFLEPTSDETLNSSFKPRNMRLSLRLSYVF